MALAEFIEWVSATGSLLTGVGTIALAMLGNQFIQNKAFEHKFDLAKEAIKIFNNLRNDLQQIRSVIGYEGETDRLKNLEEKNELIKSMKKNTGAGLALLRMDDRAESLARMNRLEPEFKAIFSETDAFEQIRAVRHEIYVAAYMLGQGENNIDKLKVIYSAGPDDAINKRIDDAVNKIEKICHPILQGKK